jgi:hypothetical protein
MAAMLPGVTTATPLPQPLGGCPTPSTGASDTVGWQLSVAWSAGEPHGNLPKWDRHGDGWVCVRTAGRSQEATYIYEPGGGNADINIIFLGDTDRQWTGVVVKDNNQPLPEV